jgi:hypothetical protein
MFTLPLLVILNTLVSGVILFESLCAMNQMSPRTPHKLRIAYILLSIGAVHTPFAATFPSLLMNLSIAYLLFIHQPKRDILKGTQQSFSQVGKAHG